MVSNGEWPLAESVSLVSSTAVLEDPKDFSFFSESAELPEAAENNPVPPHPLKKNPCPPVHARMLRGSSIAGNTGFGIKGINYAQVSAIWSNSKSNRHFSHRILPDEPEIRSEVRMKSRKFPDDSLLWLFFDFSIDSPRGFIDPIPATVAG